MYVCAEEEEAAQRRVPDIAAWLHVDDAFEHVAHNPRRGIGVGA